MKVPLVAFTLCLLTPSISSAHFLWLVSQPQETGARVHVYFGEDAGPDDPELLDKVSAAKVWTVGGRGEPELVSLKKGDESLEGTVKRAGSPLILQHTYGVITRGTETFLLNYYAKTYPSTLIGTWTEIADKQRLPLEITPAQRQGEVVFSVTWNSEPLEGSTVTVIGPGISDKLEGVTNSAGKFACQLPQAGTYSIRAKHTEATPGALGEQAYQSSRHYSTLTLNYQPALVAPQAHAYPDLPQGTTSFGGAVAGNTLYVFGGNYGDAHSYSEAGQSGDLWTLSLSEPQAWNKLSIGPKLQGLSLAAYNGRVYRVGGFAAQNKESEPEHLVSQADFARLSQDGKSWEPLTPLPAGRSSHDIAVVGDKLYVVGGWNMAGSGRDATWHDSMLFYDLKSDNGQWVETAKPPFTRRALAAAAWNGKLVVIGGMSKTGGPTTEVAIYDPQSDSWSNGPAIHGGPMDGFGASAFAVGDQLIVTTVTGSIQRLRPGQSSWDYLGQLGHNRFFHRVLPLGQDGLVIVGGANMEEGKTNAVEVLRFPVADLNRPADTASE